ncbi:MAG: lytic transglycosylase domain-containing protein [Deltaproteobacteria bacterium]|nr:lytic transglycosylase domain-containing protein [Deltaproteobacteria bacterium]
MKILEYSRKELKGIEETTPFRNGKGQIEKGADHAKKGVDKEKVKIRNQIKTIAIELGLEPGLALSMAKVESGYDPKKVSPKGAIGVLQVMPKLAKHDFGITREMLFDPQVNIIIGISWMKSLLKRFDQNLDLSLAAYNAGASRVVKAGYRVPRIKETQAYVRKVKEHMENEVSWPVEKI